MRLARDIARELLPYVVMLWATFALLDGALEDSRTIGADEGRVAVSAEVGICAITMVCAATVVVARILPLLRRGFKLGPLRLFVPCLRRLIAYHRPPPRSPSLVQLQILRI